MIRPRGVRLAPSAGPVLDGRLGRSFFLTLTGDTTPVFTRLTPGMLYVLSVEQDGTGNHALTLPSNAYGFADISPTPRTRTVQVFLAQKGGDLVAAKIAGLIEVP
jgi:hypothetical protein